MHTLFDLYKDRVLALEKCLEKSGLDEKSFILKYREYYAEL